jgi:hypothetical protein
LRPATVITCIFSFHIAHHETNTFSSPVASLYRIGLKALYSGNILSSGMVCGPDCTYMIQFDGPYIECTEVISSNISTLFTKEIYITNQMGINLMYSGQENDTKTDTQNFRPYPWTLSRFEISTSRIVGFWPMATSAGTGSVARQTNTNFSSPAWPTPYHAPLRRRIEILKCAKCAQHRIASMQPMATRLFPSSTYPRFVGVN